MAALVVVTVSSAARAEDPETLIKQGVELRRQGLDSRAEGYFRRAHQIAATPRTAAQLGLVELAVSEFFEADGHLSEALAAHDPWVNEHRAALESSRAQARKHLVRVKITGAPKGTTYALEGGDSLSLPADSTVSLAPGTTSVRFEATGRTGASRTITGAAGETREVAIDLPLIPVPVGAPAPMPVAAAPAATPAPVANPEEAPAPAPQTPDEPASARRGLRIGGIVVGGVGVVSAVVGGVLLSQGNSKVADINGAAASKSGGTYDASKDGNYGTLQGAGVGAIIAGAVAVAGGVTLFVLGSRGGEASHDAGSVAFVPAPGAGLVTYGGRF